MAWIITKYLITAAVVVLISEMAKRSDKLGGMIAALPVITFLTLIWLYVEKQPTAKISNHAYYTFWYVLPTLPMFIAFPAILDRFGFWPAMAGSVAISAICFGALSVIVKYFGIDLL